LQQLTSTSTSGWFKRRIREQFNKRDGGAIHQRDARGKEQAEQQNGVHENHFVSDQLVLGDGPVVSWLSKHASGVLGVTSRLRHVARLFGRI